MMIRILFVLNWANIKDTVSKIRGWLATRCSRLSSKLPASNILFCVAVCLNSLFDHPQPAPVDWVSTSGLQRWDSSKVRGNGSLKRPLSLTHFFFQLLCSGDCSIWQSVGLPWKGWSLLWHSILQKALCSWKCKGSTMYNGSRRR